MSLAGYATPPLAGLGAASLLSRGHAPMLLALAVAAMPPILIVTRDLFTLLSPEPFNSKRSYVEGRLQGMSLVDLTKLAHRVAAEYDVEHLQPLLDASGAHGVAGELKNLIFAADGPKAEIVFSDALNNDVLVVKNEQFCLVYDRPLGAEGLTWAELTSWWADRAGLTDASAREVSLGKQHYADETGDAAMMRRSWIGMPVCRLATSKSSVPPTRTVQC
jgi:hypothetical protein